MKYQKNRNLERVSAKKLIFFSPIRCLLARVPACGPTPRIASRVPDSRRARGRRRLSAKLPSSRAKQRRGTRRGSRVADLESYPARFGYMPAGEEH
jgi:hypothetical protein